MSEHNGFVIVDVVTEEMAGNRGATLFWDDLAEATAYRDGLADLWETLREMSDFQPHELRGCSATLVVDAAEEVTP